MLHGLDTSVLVRLVTGLPEEPARQVGELIASGIRDGDEYAVSSLVLSETYFALQHHYGFTKEEALHTLRALAGTPGLRVSATNLAILDTPGLAKANPGFVDRMIVGEYALSGLDTFSCEKAFRKLSGTTVIP